MRTMGDIKGACVIDEAGCWNWKGGYASSTKFSKNPTPYCSWGPGYGRGPGGQKRWPTRRAAWDGAGKEIPEGHEVWGGCGNWRCVNPDHSKCGTPKEKWAFIKASGAFQGSSARAVANKRNREVQAVPRERVKAIESLLSTGMTIRAASAITGVGEDTVAKIRNGKHVNSSASQRVIRGASVFAL